MKRPVSRSENDQTVFGLSNGMRRKSAKLKKISSIKDIKLGQPSNLSPNPQQKIAQKSKELHQG